ncbi:MAG: dimethyl sulfoxide reductase anchor subunit [Gemmatimonadota bacterium]
MKERSLVAFTLVGQTAVGMFWGLALVSRRVPDGDVWVRGPTLVVGGLLLVAGLAALFHLGAPRNAWRAVSNLGSSWLSREVALTGLFVAGWVVVTIMRDVVPGEGPAAAARSGAASAATVDLATALTALAGAGLVYAMARVYQLRTVPIWDTRLTPLWFFVTALSLGAPAAALSLSLSTSDGGVGSAEALRALVAVGIASIIMDLVAETGWRVTKRVAAIRVDAGLNPPTKDLTTPWRVGLMWAGLAASIMAWLAAAGDPASPVFAAAIGLALAAVAVAEVLGRARFYGSYVRSGL